MGYYVSDKKNARFFGLKLSLNRDKDLIEKLESVPNVQIYLKRLIRADLEKNHPDTASYIDAASGEN